MTHDSFYEHFADSLYEDGKPINLVKLTNKNNVSITLMDIGATWLRCQLPLKNTLNESFRDIILFAKNLSAHKKQTAYLGVTVGPYANRIANACYHLNGKHYSLLANEGENALHGGQIGLDKLRFEIAHISKQSVHFKTQSLIDGFAKPIAIEVIYELSDDDSISLTYKGLSSEDTFLNLTNHAYFNLSGIESEHSIFDHFIYLNSNNYLELSESNIPTGRIVNCKNTDADLTTLSQFKRPYDTAFILEKTANQSGKADVVLISPDKDVSLKLFTTKPSIQLYTADFMTNAEGPFGMYPRSHGVAIEPQYFPDGPNHPEWVGKNGFLKANSAYEHKTIYQLTFSQ
ncbi:galactose-1-epimerase [Thorsellia kenyensis]|uniref:Aldose 1-epimerase n=1 Tax=Thorsellia kenyensis TaxID=1549888 RepID=A0ABV6CD98_9GAMM